MSKMWILGITLIVLLASIFLISSGTMEDTSWLWWIGLVMLGGGGLIPPLTRFLFDGNENEDKEPSTGEGE